MADTCSSLLPRSNPKYVYSLLRSFAGSSSSSSSSSNFPNCSSPKKSALVFADYIRYHFFVFQSQALRSRAGGYLSELHRATWPEESHSSFSSSFSPAESLAAAFNFSSSIAIGPGKVAYLMLKHFLALAWIFSYTFSIFPGLSFLSFHLKGIFYFSHP